MKRGEIDVIHKLSKAIKNMFSRATGVYAVNTASGALTLAYQLIECDRFVYTCKAISNLVAGRQITEDAADRVRVEIGRRLNGRTTYEGLLSDTDGTYSSFGIGWWSPAALAYAKRKRLEWITSMIADLQAHGD